MKMIKSEMPELTPTKTDENETRDKQSKQEKTTTRQDKTGWAGVALRDRHCV